MNFITRTDWGARLPRSAYQILNATGGIGLHWEGPTMGTFSHDQCAGKIRGIQDFHMDTRGWIDIAYNFVVCPHRYVFEGRGYKHRSAANGTNDANGQYYAVCWLSGQNDPFTNDSKLGFLDIIQVLRTPTGAAGSEIQPHSVFFNTACPGPDVRSWIAAGIPSPIPSPPGVNVPPKWNPPIGIQMVADCPGSPQGAWILGSHWETYAVGGSHAIQNLVGNPNLAGRVPAQITPGSSFPDAPWNTYPAVVTATSGERYGLNLT